MIVKEIDRNPFPEHMKKALNNDIRCRNTEICMIQHCLNLLKNIPFINTMYITDIKQ